MRLTIEKLVYGGDGLARTEQGVVFVHRAAPGDVLDVEIAERKSDYAIGRIRSILEPSQDRQTPSCPNYDAAGCCHWQHIQYPRQLEIKQEIVRETLRRIGRMSWDRPIPIISGPDRRYRFRARFHVRRGEVGFLQERSHTFAPIRSCDALTESLNQFVSEAPAFLREAKMAGAEEIHAVSGPPTAATFTSASGRILGRFGSGNPHIMVNGFTYELNPDAFFQSNQFLLGDFMNEVVALAGPEPGHTLDLFCGSGFFSIPMARRAVEVIGVDSNAAGIRQARINAKLNDVRNAEFFSKDVEGALRSSDLQPTVVLLNPPRTGCGRQAAERIADLGARRIVYASCNPSTFAREAEIFVRRGYACETLIMVDQFPNTYHIELVAAFIAGPARS